MAEAMMVQLTKNADPDQPKNWVIGRTRMYRVPSSDRINTRFSGKVRAM